MSNIQPRFWRWSTALAIYIVAVVIAFTLVGHISASNSRDYLASISAINEIQMRITQGHLWFEELISGDPDRSLEDIYSYFEEAQANIKGLLDGMVEGDLRVRPVQAKTTRNSLQLLATMVQDFRQQTEQRYASMNKSGIASATDQQYDALYNSLINMADHVHNQIETDIHQDLVRLRGILLFLIVTALLCSLILVILFLREDRQLSTTMQDLQQANEKLRSHNEQMESFIYAISHDLKSPVVTVVGFLKYLKQDLEGFDNESTHDAVSRIEKAANRMRHSIDDLLELSRIGRVPLEIDKVDTSSLVSSVAKDLQASLVEAEADLDLEGDFPVVEVDPNRLRDVFDNLISNAIKYGCPAPGGRITVSGELQDHQVLFSVTDKGPGIEPREQDKVFGLFQRLDKTKQGTGVGLAIVKRIVEVHGGRIGVKSDPGQGASFWFTIPIKTLIVPADD